MEYLGFDHIGINVSDFKTSLDFYDRVLLALEFTKVKETEISARWSNGKNSFSIKQTAEERLENKYHRKNPGINHIAFRAASRGAVDVFYHEVLEKFDIPTLYASPKDYPEYREGYYAVFFEDPDRFKIEVMWASGV